MRPQHDIGTSLGAFITAMANLPPNLPTLLADPDPELMTWEWNAAALQGLQWVFLSRLMLCSSRAQHFRVCHVFSAYAVSLLVASRE